MVCDIGRIVPRWLLSTLNFLILIITFLLLLVSVLLICVPHYIKDLLTYILSRPQLQISLVSQDSITHNISPVLLSQLGWLSLTISFLLLLPALLGYVGAVRESRICLILYFLPIVILWSGQLTFLIVFPVVKTHLYNALADIGKASLVMYGGMHEEQNIVTFIWNILMVHLECCGVTSHQDFQLSDSWNEHKEKFQMIPAACCMLETSNYPISRIYPVDQHCTTVPTKYNSYWTQGCLPRAASVASDYTSLIILVIISILTLEVLVIILACCLCMLQKFRSDKTCHTIVVRKESPRNPNDTNNWHNSGLQDEQKNLIYNDMRNDIIVP